MTTERDSFFPSRLRGLREDLGLTQAELADAVGSDNVQISRYENGAILPSVETLSRLADILKCSTDYLLGRSNKRHLDAGVAGDFNSDERRLLQAIRERDVQVTFVLLSMLFASPFPRHVVSLADAQRHREMGDERVRRNRERSARRAESAARMVELKDIPPAPEPSDQEARESTD